MPADIRSAFVLLDRQHWLRWAIFAIKMNQYCVCRRGPLGGSFCFDVLLVHVIASTMWAKQRTAQRIYLIVNLDKGCHFISSLYKLPRNPRTILAPVSNGPHADIVKGSNHAIRPAKPLPLVAGCLDD